MHPLIREPVICCAAQHARPLCACWRRRNRDAGGSAVVKGCPIPALNRRHVGIHRRSVGRCWTSLEGGNRGMLPQGQEDAPGYGDLNRGVLE